MFAMRKLVLVLMLIFSSGCQTAESRASIKPQAPAEPIQPIKPLHQPALRLPESQVLVYVNGKPIYLKALVDVLLRGPGLTYAQQLVTQELVHQEMVRNELTVSEDEIDAEAERILKLMAPQAGAPHERQRILARILSEKQVSREQWTASVRMSARLRKLAEPKAEVTDDMLQREFGRRYGRQVVVRDIEVESLEKIQSIIDELQAGGEFEKLAWKYSIGDSARRNGLLDPIGPDTRDVAPAVREVALSLEKKGEISDPIQVGTSFHVLKLEEIIEPKNVKFADVQDEIRTAVRESLISYHQRQILAELRRRGKVEYVDPLMKRLDAEGKGP